jgi:hypothetical protein
VPTLALPIRRASSTETSITVLTREVALGLSVSHSPGAAASRDLSTQLLYDRARGAITIFVGPIGMTLAWCREVAPVGFFSAFCRRNGSAAMPTRPRSDWRASNLPQLHLAAARFRAFVPGMSLGTHTLRPQ